jgi:hypothetical protein
MQEKKKNKELSESDKEHLMNEVRILLIALCLIVIFLGGNYYYLQDKAIVEKATEYCKSLNMTYKSHNEVFIYCLNANYQEEIIRYKINQK